MVEEVDDENEFEEGEEDNQSSNVFIDKGDLRYQIDDENEASFDEERSCSSSVTTLSLESNISSSTENSLLVKGGRPFDIEASGNSDSKLQDSSCTNPVFMPPPLLPNSSNLHRRQRSERISGFTYEENIISGNKNNVFDSTKYISQESIAAAILKPCCREECLRKKLNKPAEYACLNFELVFVGGQCFIYIAKCLVDLYLSNQTIKNSW